MGKIFKGVGKLAGNVIGGITGANAAAKGARRAADTQVAAAQGGIDEIRKLLSPFIGAGTQALGSQQALLGLSGAEAQQAAIEALRQSPFFTAQLEQGQNLILQNASATGGLRGGNTQAALAQFAPRLLAQTLQQQLGNLGGLVQGGQNAATNAAGSISELLGQQGAARAGAQLAQGQRQGQIFGSALQLGGLALGGLAGGTPGAALGGQLGGSAGGFLSGGGTGGSGIGGGFITNPTANIQGLF